MNNHVKRLSNLDLVVDNFIVDTESEPLNTPKYRPVMLVSTTVYVRAGLLLALIVLFLRSETTIRAGHAKSGTAEVQTPADLVLRPGIAPP